jgi:hypothetical protein
MSQNNAHGRPQVTEKEWVSFPGGELEARRPRALCAACRVSLQEAAFSQRRPVLDAREEHGAGASGMGVGPLALKSRSPLCFQCYRAELNRERELKVAGQIDTASVERFQEALPFEPVNMPRLESLKVERQAARVELTRSTGGFVDKRRHAQIAARHALQQLAAGLRARKLTPSDRERAIASAIHAAELQLPESWMPFVVSR